MNRQVWYSAALTWALSAVGVPVAAQPKDAGAGCTLQGLVSNANTGEPLRKATVRVRQTAKPSEGSTEPDSWSATTGNDGLFRVEGVPLKELILSVERTGFATQGFGAGKGVAFGRRFTLATCDAGRQYLLEMVPEATISGRLVDEDVEPIPQSAVNVLRLAYFNGRRQVAPVRTVMSAADGSFIATGLPPGRYYVYASGRMPIESVLPPAPANAPRPKEVPVGTYFGNATELGGAAAIDLSAGMQVRAEIKMRTAPAYRVFGRVVASGKAPPVNAVFALIPADNSGTALARRIQVQAHQGRFAFERVLPGNYWLQAMIGSPSRRMITVGKSDVETEFAFTDGLNLSGRVTEGKPPEGTPTGDNAPPPLSLKVRILLMDTAGMYVNLPAANSDSDGNFRIDGIQPDLYQVGVSNLPAGAYVKRILFEGVDVAKAPLNLSNGVAAALQLELSPGAGEVTGVVLDKDGKAIAGATVTAWSLATIPYGFFPIVRQAIADAAGAFRISNLAPGTYRVVGFSQIDQGLAMAPEFYSRFSGKATTFEVTERSAQNVQLKGIEAAEIEIEALKIR